MQLLATSPEVVFDSRYPAEYRFLSYFARMAEQMTEPFDAERHVGVTPFFFSSPPEWGPVPFTSDVVDVGRLQIPLLRSMWAAWSDEALARHSGACYYAEKLAVPIQALVEAGIDLRVIDLLRDPRDVLASIRHFTSGGIDGFNRRSDQSEDDYLDDFIARTERHVESVHRTHDVDRIVVRYEDLAADLAGASSRIGRWLDIRFDAQVVLDRRHAYRHHMTTGSVHESIGRWRRDLRPAEAEKIARAVGPLFQPFGYDF
jgi:hypothetical protein